MKASTNQAINTAILAASKSPSDPRLALAGGLARIIVSGSAMFGQLRTRWSEARAAQLKRQFENASLYVGDLGDEQAQRFVRGLNYLSTTGSIDLGRSKTARCALASIRSRK